LRRILLVAPSAPFPPLDGDRLVLWNLLQGLRGRWQFDLLCMSSPGSREVPGGLAKLCSRVVALPVDETAGLNRMRQRARAWMMRRPTDVERLRACDLREQMTHMLQRQRYDLVYLGAPALALYAQDAFHCCPTVVAPLDARVRQVPALARATGGVKAWAIAREQMGRLRRFERHYYQFSDACLVLSRLDREALLDLNPGLPVGVVPLGIDVAQFAGSAGETASQYDVVFSGNLSYAPNDAAARELVTKVMPELRRHMPGLRLGLVGVRPSARLKSLVAADKLTRLTGYVADIGAELRQGKVFACPVAHGSGMRVKVLEAMAAGLPIVTYPGNIEELPVQHGVHLMIARSQQGLAELVRFLLNEPQLRSELGRAARCLVEERFSLSAMARAFEAMLEEAIERGRARLASCAPVAVGRRAVQPAKGSGQVYDWNSPANDQYHREHRESGKDAENPPCSSDSLCDPCGRPDSRGRVPGLAAKVMFVVDRLDEGGAERIVVEMLKQMARSPDVPGFELSVCTTREAGRFAGELDGLGIRHFCLQRRSRFDLLGFWNLVRLLRRERPDIIHTHKVGSNTIGRVAALITGVPVVIAHEHTLPDRGRMQKLVDHFLARASDCVVTCDSVLRQALIRTESLDPARVAVIPNGVDVARFERARQSRVRVREELHVDDAPVVGTFARLAPQKDIGNLLAAVPPVLRGVPAARFVIAGDGPLRGELERQAATLGISERVRFLGFRTDTPELLSAIDLFVLPSAWEGLPVTILEAMASRKPVVATDVGGIRDAVVAGQTGLLVPAGRPLALAAGILQVIRDPNLANRLGQAGYERVSSDFSIEAMVNSTRNLYHRLMTRTTENPERTQRILCALPIPSVTSVVALTERSRPSERRHARAPMPAAPRPADRPESCNA
jgi:glycosyltransferase involved in cell wall biosynthesis